MNVGHFLDIRHTQAHTHKKKYPFKVAAHLSRFISAAVTLIIFGLQLTKRQRNFKPISWQTSYLRALELKWLTGQSNFITSHTGFAERKAFHGRLYLSADCFYFALRCCMERCARCKIAFLPKETHYICEPWSRVCLSALSPSSCAPVPPSQSLCSFAVMSSNPAIYVPAGKHGLPFIVLR